MRRITFLPLLALCATAACVEELDTGRADYARFCAGCHGASGAGDSDMAQLLESPPADLTQIAARNGGMFPRVEVMSKVYGYTQTDQHGATMPQFGPLLEGKTVLYDSGDGKQTPTPWRLVALTEYLEGLQTPAK